MKKRIAVLGSTGSIGTQTLEVIEEQKDMFDVEVLSANTNSELLVKQSILHTDPTLLLLLMESWYDEVFKEFNPFKHKSVLWKLESLEQIVCSDNIDMVLTALVGYSGLLPTISAIKVEKKLL